LRALIAMVVLLGGCDFLFRIDTIEIHDGATVVGNGTPKFEAAGWTAYPGDGTLHSSVEVALDGAVDSNALLVVALCSFPTAASIEITDSVGSTYTRATMADGVLAQPALAASLYYAVAPMPTGALVVHVAFSGTGAESPDVRVTAYANVSPIAPFEVAASHSMVDVDVLDTSVTVSSVPTLLVAATCVGGQTTAIDGFQIRAFSAPNGDALGDSLSDTVSDEIATAHQNPADGMIVQLAAFHGI
jgi:hypothetical protein